MFSPVEALSGLHILRRLNVLTSGEPETFITVALVGISGTIRAPTPYRNYRTRLLTSSRHNVQSEPNFRTQQDNRSPFPDGNHFYFMVTCPP